ncbi:MAG: methylaspartate mutase subunit E [Defluviitaleaceae bacterium]|nr:methylaspartate mutase subunit E [Defluviitaleaceae bacterium]
MKHRLGNKKLENKKWDEDYLHSLRKEVLEGWPTGAGVDLEEAFAYQKAIPEEKNFSKKLQEADKKGITLIQPRAGVALADEHLELLKYLEDNGNADLLPSTIDSYTRHNKYTEAQVGIDESIAKGRSLLNGFPAVNHGVAVCRKITSTVKSPVQVRHGTPDARLLLEITIAGGFTSYEGGAISYNIPYSKSIPLEQTLYDWQYIDRLIGLYEEKGIRINREPFGPLTGTLVPPCISHAVAIIEALLAAEQGTKCITAGYGQCGNLVQDVAAIKSLKRLTKQYLENAGYGDVLVTTVLHQWMGGFPANESSAYGVISLGATAAALSKATKVIVKTPHEAMGIPTKEANAGGLLATKQVVNMLKDQSILNTKEVELEALQIEKETNAILSKALELGEGDILIGAIKAIELGIIDIPYAPSKYNADKLFPARDNDGAVRILETGNLPFDAETKEFHAEKLKDRAKIENREVSINMAIDDIYAVSNGVLIGGRQ